MDGSRARRRASAGNATTPSVYAMLASSTSGKPVGDAVDAECAAVEHVADQDHVEAGVDRGQDESSAAGAAVGDQAARDRAVVAQPRAQRGEDPLPGGPGGGAGEEAVDQRGGAEPGEREPHRDRDAHEVASDLRADAPREAHVAQQHASWTLPSPVRSRLSAPRRNRPAWSAHAEESGDSGREQRRRGRTARPRCARLMRECGLDPRAEALLLLVDDGGLHPDVAAELDQRDVGRDRRHDAELVGRQQAGEHEQR